MLINLQSILTIREVFWEMLDTYTLLVVKLGSPEADPGGVLGLSRPPPPESQKNNVLVLKH